MSYSERFDVVVIGAGHAGIEAALAAARSGSTTLILTPNLDRIGFMPCNPSIGGPAKGHLVRDLDALGGEMGRTIDRTAIQVRKLNTSKGPAVQALRAQADKSLYQMAMKEALELQDRLTLRQELVRDVEIAGQNHDRRVVAVTTDHGNRYLAGAVVVTAGTFFRGNMIAGEWRAAGGRAGDVASVELSTSLRDISIQLRRLKTGTPPRVDARTVDFTETKLHSGSEEPLWFSFDGQHDEIERLALPPLSIYPDVDLDGWRAQMPCYLVHTNPATHQIIADNIDRAPMYNGAITGTGPRYCPSIEDKIVRFRDKPAHGLFLEPEGWRTTELYVQGANTSLPHDVQLQFLRTIPAMRDVSITRYGYAVEYDAIDSTELMLTMEAKKVRGLFLAGQVCGTSGYEEAAGQGIVAGINASCFAHGGEPLILRRDQSYIGVMIDDLTTQEFIEPYRMLTSRAEYRLLLRSDNAESRLSEIGYRYGLISRARLDQIHREQGTINQAIEALSRHYLSGNERIHSLLRAQGLEPPSRNLTALEYLRRPDTSYVQLAAALNAREFSSHPLPDWSLDAKHAERVEVEVRYGAYIQKELKQVERARKLEHRVIPRGVDYSALPSLRNEAREKLTVFQPATLGQASRIAGVTPGDIAVLLVHLERVSVANPIA
ncbi:MAG: tRNA uridine-5-carboxymethylaminomethyl(34) synthesis enzyme MnmG [Nitrolancea sp.]